MFHIHLQNGFRGEKENTDLYRNSIEQKLTAIPKINLFINKIISPSNRKLYFYSSFSFTFIFCKESTK